MRSLYFGFLILGLAGIIALAPAIVAEQVGQKDVLDKAWRNTDLAKERDEFVKGKAIANATDKKRAEMVAETSANYCLYRITHPISESIVHEEFTKFVDAIKKHADANQAFVNILGPKMVESMKEVLRAQNPKKDVKTIVNAAIMLPTMARLKQNDVGMYLVELLNDKDAHPVIRFNAAKALREFLPITNDADRRKLETAVVDALTSYIENPPMVPGMTNAEIEGIRFMRREAIISLSKAELPAVDAPKTKKGKDVPLVGPVAPTLLKVLAKDQLQPPPSLQEKVEAAIGLCSMKCANMPDYNSDIATCLIGQTLVEFAFVYSKDLTNFEGGKKNPFLPWKHDAELLQKGLQKQAEYANTPRAKDVKDKSQIFLESIRNHKKADFDGLISLVQSDNFYMKVETKVFKTRDTPTIPLK